MHEYVVAAEVWGIDADIFAGWGQWFGAIGSIAAVAVALWVAFRDGRRRDVERRDQEKAQARTITSRVGTVAVTMGPIRGTVPAVWIENHGTAPITNIILESVSAFVGDQRRTKWSISDHADQSPYIVAPVIGPGQAEAAEPLRFTDAEETSRWPDPTTASVTFAFTDALGLTWRKADNGEPQRLLLQGPGRRRILRLRGRHGSA